ncbi:TIGR01777 family oxidoreductase [Halalkalibacterium ligniniphilum]|uniref:TIGR01777 family oxidoreductase n=1 Tax=Halalkalibacterium ligniniphilum TaxID=1134413 RepID=UPI0003459341|nr:TIGR01777 family oxidoreductase [Halalkalibacterium ligniniphilum]
MKIAISGGSGFIGTKLSDVLIDEGHEVFILTRSLAGKENKERLTFVKWLTDGAQPALELEGIDAIVNLAGESIGDGRWTKERKKQILQSRIDATNAVIDLISTLKKKPEVIVNASAIGYYGNSETETFTEQSNPVNQGFLATVVKRWEETASRAAEYGVRTVYTRIGIVLHKEEGALPRMLLPYKILVGGTIGSGKQWLSWIHIDDVIGMMLFALKEPSIEGPFNLTAPNPVQMKPFGKALADVTNRPHWAPAPAIALKIMLGEMSTLVLDGQRVLPEIAKKMAYPYKFQELKPALENLLKK